MWKWRPSLWHCQVLVLRATRATHLSCLLYHVFPMNDPLVICKWRIISEAIWRCSMVKVKLLTCCCALKKLFSPSSFLSIIFIDSCYFWQLNGQAALVHRGECNFTSMAWAGALLPLFATPLLPIPPCCCGIALPNLPLTFQLTYPTYMSFYPSVVWHFFIVQVIELVRSGSFKRLIFMYLVL
jgi:hypothetical protein